MKKIINNYYNLYPDKIYKKELFKTLRFPEGVVYEDLGLIYKLFDILTVE